MAAGAFVPYEAFVGRYAQTTDGDHDWDAQAKYCILTTNAYTPSASSHSTLADVTGEVTDTDYAPKNLTSLANTRSGSTVTLDCGDIGFGDPVTITAKYAIIVEGTVAAKSGTDKLVGYCDLNTSGGSVVVVAGLLNLVIASTGVFQLTVA